MIKSKNCFVISPTSILPFLCTIPTLSSSTLRRWRTVALWRLGIRFCAFVWCTMKRLLEVLNRMPLGISHWELGHFWSTPSLVSNKNSKHFCEIRCIQDLFCGCCSLHQIRKVSQANFVKVSNSHVAKYDHTVTLNINKTNFIMCLICKITTYLSNSCSYSYKACMKIAFNLDWETDFIPSSDTTSEENGARCTWTIWAFQLNEQ